MSCHLPFRVHPRTIRRAADPQLSFFATLPSGQDRYLYSTPDGKENTDPGSASLRDILLWRVPVGESAIDPLLISGYQEWWQRSKPVVLAIAPTPFDGVIPINDVCVTVHLPDDDAYLDVEGLTAFEVEWDLAWRLERHWQVEWMEHRERVRPPFLFVSENGVHVLGSTLPPKSRPALAALGAFPLVTADELSATLKYLGSEPLSAPELSRVLGYCLASGILTVAPDSLAESYWKQRGERDQRPLRVFASAAAHLARICGRDSDTSRREWTSLWHLDKKRPSRESADLLRRWKRGADEFSERGVPTYKLIDPKRDDPKADHRERTDSALPAGDS